MSEKEQYQIKKQSIGSQRTGGSNRVMHSLAQFRVIPASWYFDISEEIDWGLYDEEEEDIAEVTDDIGDRRQYVFNSFVNNYL